MYNNITSSGKLSKLDDQNKYLMTEFLDYLKSVDRAESTIKQYESDMNIFFVWNLELNGNKPFVEISKREYVKFQNHAINEWGWSPKRLRRVKSVISSLSNYIENILDEEKEFSGYRSVIKKIESPVNVSVREKSVFTPEELQELLDALVEKKESEAACALSLAMCSARRKAELTRFKVSYFHERNILFGSLYKTPEMVVTKGRGSKGKMLYLYVLKRPFDPYLRLWLDERKEKGIESEWLFPNMSNMDEHVDISTFNTWAKQFSKMIGKDFYWHSMRHYATTEFVKSNLPTNVIQDIIGWESADMVSLYTDISADDNIGKYFDENGIKNTDRASLSDM